LSFNFIFYFRGAAVNTDFHNVDRSFVDLRAVLIFSLTVFACLGGHATTGVADDMHGDRGDRGIGPGLGIGTGIGIGIGIGQGLSQQPSTAPTNPASRKKPIDPPTLKFVGKPDNVAFNPQQKDGKLGDLNDHKQITVAKDGSYFVRHYYYARDGKQLSWYYYDAPANPKETATAQHQDSPNCLLNDDNCDGPPQRPLYVDNNTPAPDAGTTDGGVKTVDDEKDCPGGVIRVSVATTSCPDGFVHNIDDHYNYCPPDTTNYHHVHTDTPTKTPCSPGTNPGPGKTWTPPDVPDARGACSHPIEVRTEEHAEDVGGVWEITIYPIYKCDDGKEYYGQPETVEDGRVDKGGPKPPLDQDKLVPKPK
jgi:hypothetical protein